jgi:beta-lysine 5,6-aminomutase alpha subunit
MMTEAMHTPLLQDRYFAIRNAKYIFNGAKDLGKDITFNADGTIQSWASKVLDDTHMHLEAIAKKGLFKSIEERAFAEVKRTETGGKGYDGVVSRDPEYTNPFFETL